MCSINGLISLEGKEVYLDLLDMLYMTKHRGPDGFGIRVEKDQIQSKQIRNLQNHFLKGSIGLAHARLAIVGSSLQPISDCKNELTIVHNGEIYNWKELEKQLPSHNFKTNTDSELVAHFFEGKNILTATKDFMKKAVGNYAIGILKNNKLYAFRDPIGIKPLWFGKTHDSIVFSSEPIALRKFDINFPTPLLPGHLLELSEKGVKEFKIFDIKDLERLVPKKSSFESLHKSFQKSIDYRTDGVNKAGVFFSGGIDSSLIAKAVSEKVDNTKLYTVGVEDAEDVVYAEKVAKELDLDLNLRLLQKDELPEYAIKSLKAITFFADMQIQIALPEYVAAEEAKKDNCKVIFSGQGSDEIFAGYSYYKRFLKEGGYSLVQSEIWNSLAGIWNRNLYREDVVSMAHSLELRVPFLDLDFIKQGMAISPKEKIYSQDDELRKHSIRKLGGVYGLPKNICNRKKRAMQYGSGLGKHIAKLFKPINNIQ